jgi:hypothetical protein
MTKLMPERPARNLLAVTSRELAGEHRDTERAITLWHQKTADGTAPSLPAFDSYRLTGDWGYRFVISGDEVVAAAVFIIYGLHFARLLDLPEKPRNTIPLIQQLPARYHQLFAEGCSEAITQAAPARFSGAAVRHDGKIELYRAAFMPIQGLNSSRPLIFGSFNHRLVPQESASDAFRTYCWIGGRARREAQLRPAREDQPGPPM